VSGPPRGAVLILFGATGDLARKKLFPALYHLAAAGRLNLPVVGVASSAWDDAELAKYATTAIEAAVSPVDDAVMEALLGRLAMVSGDYQQPATFQTLARRLEQAGCRRPVHYLAIPPSLFAVVIEGLAAAGLQRDARVVVEKPFGRDLTSARELNRVLHQVFPEQAIFRIDHYLGKESVENLLVFRFAISFLEPIWNRRYVSNAQVTMASRSAWRDEAPSMTAWARCAMSSRTTSFRWWCCWPWNPPSTLTPTLCGMNKVKVLKAMRPADPGHLVRGQYDGYLDEPGVAPGSTVETFAALRVEIDSWRWAGVPFHLRAGKALATTALEVIVELQAPPRLLFCPDGCQPHPNFLRFRLGRHDGVTLSVQAKQPGERLVSHPVNWMWTSSESSAPARKPTSVSSVTPSTGTRPASPGRTASRTRGVSSSLSWASLAPSTVIGPIHGAHRKPISWWPATSDGTIPRHEIAPAGPARCC
jgi:glucose-6-phosphate 1-dehydrogenase